MTSEVNETEAQEPEEEDEVEDANPPVEQADASSDLSAGDDTPPPVDEPKRN